MSKPTILTVDDDPLVSAAITRDLRRQYGADYRIVRATSGAEALAVLTELALRDRAGRADRRRPADAADDRHRDARAGARARTGREVPAAHRVRRHRRRDQGDQRHRPRLLPAQAVGPARGAALPGRRRPARRLAARPTPTTPPTSASSATAGRTAATRSRRSWPATTCRTAGSTSSATTRASGCATSPSARADDLPLVLVPDGETLRSPTDARPRRRARPAHHAPSSRCTTSASSAAGRPGWPPRCTPRPRACSTVIVEREAPGGQAGQSAAIENYLGFPQGAERLRPRPARDRAGRPGSAPRWCSPATSSGFEARGPVRAVLLDGVRRDRGPRGDRRDRRVVPAARRRRARRPDRPRRLLRRDAERGEPVRGRRGLRRRRGQLGRPGRAEPGPLRQAGRAAGPRRLARRARCRSTCRPDRRGARTSRCAAAPRWSACRGDGHLEALTLRRPRHRARPRRSPASWLFVFIGASPRTDWLGDDVVRDDHGLRRHRPGPARRRRPTGWPLPRPPYALETSVPGVFAAGDVRLDSMKRVASAVGEGAMSVYLVHRYLATI